MIIFLSILTGFMLLDGWVWISLDRMMRRLDRPKLWRILLAAGMLAVLLFVLLSVFAGGIIGRTHRTIPQWLPASIYIWHFLVLPVTAIALLIVAVVKKIRARFRPAPPVALQSRRRFLLAAALAAPPLASVSLANIAVGQLGKFRIRRFEMAFPKWPAELDSFTIAVVADVHAGVFSTQKMLDDIVHATNNLRADLILLPGDLINISQTDLPNALDMVLRLDCPQGVYMVQGNHDCIQNPWLFDVACQNKGVPLLLDQVLTLTPRGVPIQLLGTRWTTHDRDMIQSVRNVDMVRDPAVFPILMAHHPHAWDEAAARNLPLVLAGHTHGGQIMLTKNIGAGPLRFRYWSGLYQKPSSALIVSNGVGNWFPLRVNAPAEILHLRLHRGDFRSVETIDPA